MTRLELSGDERIALFERRGLSDDERSLMAHICMWGSDGYPIRKLGRGWFWEYRSIQAPRIYKTRREAVAAFGLFHSILRDAKGGEAGKKARQEYFERYGGSTTPPSQTPLAHPVSSPHTASGHY